MKIGSIPLLILTLLILLLGSNMLYAQTQIYHQQPTLAERSAYLKLEFDVPGLNIEEVDESYIYFQYDNDLSFSQQNINFQNGKFTTEIKISNPDAAEFSYYLSLSFFDGLVVTYPAEGASAPITIQVVEPQDKEVTDLTGVSEEIEYTILSPLPDEELVPNDALIAITLFYDEGAANPDSLVLIFNGNDVTSKANMTPYFITYVPKDIKPGTHTIELIYKGTDGPKSLVSWSATVLDPRSSKAQAIASGNTLNGQATLSARSQTIFGTQENIYRGTVNIQGKQGFIKYSLNGLLTSQEDPRLQPQNRYDLELKVGEFLNLEAGHIYPRMNPLVLSGSRVYGVNAGLALFGKSTNFQFTYGFMRRAISNIYDNVSVKADTTAPAHDGFDAIVERSYQLGFESGGIGTHARRIMAARFALGSGKFFQLGFNVASVRDDTTSISTIRSYSDLKNKKPELMSGLSSIEKAELAADDKLFKTPSSNPKPQDNLVIATDMQINMFGNRFQLRSDNGISLLNNNIAPGTLTQKRLEDLGIAKEGEKMDELKWIDMLTNIIIVNENMAYFPLTFDGDGNVAFDTAIPFSILASQNSMSLNALGQTFSVKYVMVGPEYQSLANSAIRRDVQGLTLQDRFRLLSNTIYVTLGYDMLNDNVASTLTATTYTNTFRTNVSWYPVNQKLPRISIGYRSQTRDNEVKRSNPFIGSNDVDGAIYNVIIASNDTSVTAAPRFDETSQISSSITQRVSFLGMQHDVSLNYTTLNTVSNVNKFGGFTSNSYSLSMASTFAQLPLRTTVAVLVNNSEVGDGLNKVDITGFQVGGSYFMFNNKLNLFTDIAFTTNEVLSKSLSVNDRGTPDNLLDDFYYIESNTNSPLYVNPITTSDNSIILTGGARYDINKYHSLLFNYSFTNVSSSGSSNTPNDSVVQLRYLFRF